MEQGDATCLSCGNLFPLPTGRGRKPVYCPDCQARRKKRAAAIRGMRHVVSMTSEWIEALGPLILTWKEEMTQRQSGRCLRCNRYRKLYFATAEADDAVGPEQLIGLCVDCHADWSTERRTHGHRN